MEKIKVVYLIMCLLFSIVGTIVIGCKKAESGPDSGKWTKYLNGTISDIFYFDDGSSDCYWNVQFDFVNGAAIRMNRLECDHLPQKGETGVLWIESSYKDNSKSRQQDADFKWVSRPVRSIVSSSQKQVSRHTVPKSVLYSFKPEPKNIIWKDPYTSAPTPHVTVLVKLEDGIVTTAYLTQKGEWKAELFKKKMSGGTPLRNVEVWKEVDLQ